MSRNVPRRFVESSMSAPMYWLGVTMTDVDPRLADLLDVARSRHLRRVVDGDLAPTVGQLDVVLDRRRGRDQVEVELALEALLDDLHVEQPEEAAAEPEPERDRALRLVREARRR